MAIFRKLIFRRTQDHRTSAGIHKAEKGWTLEVTWMIPMTSSPSDLLWNLPSILISESTFHSLSKQEQESCDQSTRSIKSHNETRNASVSLFK